MSKVITIIVNGRPESGKDTFVEALTKKVPSRYKCISTVDKVKKAARLIGWNGVKDQEGRKLLSNLKQLSLQYDHPMSMVRDTLDSINKRGFKSGTFKILFVMSREPEEIKRFKEEIPNCYTLFIDRPGHETGISNTSDNQVTNMEYDYYVYNLGTVSELQTKAIQFKDLLFKDVREEKEDKNNESN